MVGCCEYCGGGHHGSGVVVVVGRIRCDCAMRPKDQARRGPIGPGVRLPRDVVRVIPRG